MPADRKRLTLLHILICFLLLCSGCGDGEESESIQDVASESGGNVIEAETDWIVGNWYSECQDEKYYLMIDGEGTVECLLWDNIDKLMYTVHGNWEKVNYNGEMAYQFTNEKGVFTISEDSGGLLLDGVLFEESTLNAEEFISEVTAEPLEEKPRYEVTETALNVGIISGLPHIHASAVISNNGNVPIKISDITFAIEDDQGTFLTCIGNYFTRCVPDVIMPGEKGYIACLDISFEEVTQEYLDSITSATVQFSCEANPNAEVMRYCMEDVGLSSHGGYLQLKGRIVNDTEMTAEDVYAAAALYSADGKLLGVICADKLGDIAPGKNLGFDDAMDPIPECALQSDVATIEAAGYVVAAN